MRLATGAQANMPVMVWALAFQMGISDACETHATPSGKAREFGVTRALMSYWMRYWEDLLGFRDQTYAKSKEARANMRAARMRVVERTAVAAQIVAAAKLPKLVRVEDSHGDTETRGGKERG
jgi:hypothetical protein